MKEIYRKNDQGIALVLLKYHVSNQHLFETFATCGCNIRNFTQQVEDNDGRDIKVFVSGIWRNIRKLRKLDYVDKVIFESDRKQLLIEATT